MHAKCLSQRLNADLAQPGLFGGVPGSSVDRVSDSGSRSPGFQTHAGHLVVGSDST